MEKAYGFFADFLRIFYGFFVGFSRIVDSLWDSHVVSKQISRQFDGEGLRIFYGFFVGYSRIVDSLSDSHVVSKQISRQFDGEGLRIFYGFFTDSLWDSHVLWILCGILTYCGFFVGFSRSIQTDF